MKSKFDSLDVPPQLQAFIRDYFGFPTANRVLDNNEHLLKETPPRKGDAAPVIETMGLIA